MHEFNQAMFMKINWGIISSPNALWVQVLRSKYGCGDGVLPMVQSKHSESTIWHGIRGTWNQFMEGVRWVAGDGCFSRFWKDCWVPLRIVLEEVVVQPVPFGKQEDVIASYVESNSGSWHVSEFSDLSLMCEARYSAFTSCIAKRCEGSGCVGLHSF